ncbi:hypothetical protein ACFL42_02420 [Candidatus Omnitrophota bacterium]
MQILNLKGLKKLISNIILGKRTSGLIVTIKNEELKQGRPKNKSPAPADRRKDSESSEQVINSPENRLIRPTSRSPSDIWTVIYKNQVMAKGKFAELVKILTDIPRMVFSAPKVMVRQVLLWLGFVAILGICFMIGAGMNRPAEPVKIIKEVKTELVMEDYSEDIAGLKTALEETKDRLEVLTSVVSSGMAKDERKDIAPSKKRPEQEFARKLMEVELNQLISLEQKRTTLIMQDEEFNRQGFTEFHVQRRSLAASIEALEKKIRQIRKKYDLKP